MLMALIGSDYDQMKKGDIAPEFKLKATDEKVYSLKDIKGKATLIVFMCNHCPYVKPKLKELNRTAEDFKEKGLVVLGINPNESDNYPEDSFENMQALVNEGKVKFLYLHDETQEIAKAYGAVCTPDPFLFDADLKLVFHSRIDDTHGSQPADEHELYDAIVEFLETGKISREEKPSMGCSIKWRY